VRRVRATGASRSIDVGLAQQISPKRTCCFDIRDDFGFVGEFFSGFVEPIEKKSTLARLIRVCVPACT